VGEEPDAQGRVPVPIRHPVLQIGDKLVPVLAFKQGEQLPVDDEIRIENPHDRDEQQGKVQIRSPERPGVFPSEKYHGHEEYQCEGDENSGVEYDEKSA
jgi:hypothetical protein